MHHLQSSLCRLYPGFPAEPKGFLQVRIESGTNWIHIESDSIGVRSPYQVNAIRHLHVAGEFNEGGQTRSAVILFTIVGPPRNVFEWDRLQRFGITAFDKAAWPTIWIPTAATDSITAGPVRRVWLETAQSVRCSASNHKFCLALANDFDEHAKHLAGAASA